MNPNYGQPLERRTSNSTGNFSPSAPLSPPSVNQLNLRLSNPNMNLTPNVNSNPSTNMRLSNPNLILPQNQNPNNPKIPPSRPGPPQHANSQPNRYSGPPPSSNPNQPPYNPNANQLNVPNQGKPNIRISNPNANVNAYNNNYGNTSSNNNNYGANSNENYQYNNGGGGGYNSGNNYNNPGNNSHNNLNYDHSYSGSGNYGPSDQSGRYDQGQQYSNQNQNQHNQSFPPTPHQLLHVQHQYMQDQQGSNSRRNSGYRPQMSSAQMMSRQFFQSRSVDVKDMPHSFSHSGDMCKMHLVTFGGFTNLDTSNTFYVCMDLKKGGTFRQLEVELANQKQNIPHRERHCAELIDNTLFIFGGFDRFTDKYFDDMWTLDMDQLILAQVSQQGDVPSPRCGAASCVVDGCIFIFGGRTKEKEKNLFSGNMSVSYHNTIHVFNPVNHIWKLYHPTGEAPSVRALATFTYNPQTRKIYVFGGAVSKRLESSDVSGFCDLYELNVDTMHWSEVEAQGIPPSPCYGHTATFIGDNKIVFFGGKGFNVLNAIHILDTEKKTWKYMTYSGNILVPRWNHVALYFDKKLIIHGGKDDQDRYLCHLVEIDIENDLLETDVDEISEMASRRDIQEEKRAREIISDLQTQVEELRFVIGLMVDELNNEQTSKFQLMQRIQYQKTRNIALATQIDEWAQKNQKC